jgi:chromosome segregation ATPase
MENISIVEVIVILASLIGASSPLLLGAMESRNKERRGLADDQLDLSVVAKNLSDSWEKIVEDLRTEIDRIQKDASNREQRLLSDLEGLQARLDDNQKRIDTVMANEMQRAKELTERLEKVTAEKEEVQRQLTEIKEENIFLQASVNRLKLENEALNDSLAQMRKDITAVQKKVTGELKWPKNDDGAGND